MLRVFLLLLALSSSLSAVEPTRIASGLTKPTSVTVTADKRIFACTEAGVMEIKDGQATPFAADVKSPRKVISFQQFLFVSSPAGVYRVDINNQKTMLWAANALFPAVPEFLGGLAVDERGTVYVIDTGTMSPAVYRINAIPKGRNQDPERKVMLVADRKTVPGLKAISGLTLDSINHLLIADGTGHQLILVRLPDIAVETVITKTPLVVEPVFDYFGRLYFLGDLGKTLWSIPRPGVAPVKMATFADPATGIGYDAAGNRLLITMNAGHMESIPAQPQGWEVDQSPLPLKTEIVYDKLTFTGYDNGADSGKEVPLRPIVLTHFGDGSKRTVIATQHGVIHTIKPGDTKTNVFLDIQPKCFYKDTENEQGLLGLAFHPDYKTNGELFVFYTDKAKRFENVVSRFRVKKDNPDQVDPASEEELLRIKHKYWNHDGGTLCFGPDRMLYVVLGDGGAGGDPDGHGQMRNTLLGKILRLDINRKDPGLAYAIPKDNPFVGQADYRPEIFALGVRNPWRLSFDRKTGQGWFAEVGQNLWEEINLLEKGGNYGWSVRESLHPFGSKGTGPRPELVEPIWEYHHALGKSITGGFVSRGSRLPELDGHYIYADYVFAKIWALKYDEKAKRVVANRPITDAGAAVLSFGEDEAGELYILTYSANGKGISRIVRK